ncbi:MAG: redox-sensing transcriptional repressor Rex [Lentimicrobium sp.]|jgi:redox-sensing transcriptional repressor|nr:redox-sensing transcriptional repressor Rex [Lentimicrobium sp.]MDD2526424.1 redox-sensing transcriptional repressor Rex [Lentimicrobiaceae bacterium]MDD4597344.1 redox-sensing transcriptional repressor Rex [Lentimicrobiaceae bacterium]MDY0026390.1 redox-sensing transcriptional repressor Rex [Lentimicrobium sp.]HAH57825.1 redox-sensing transcriptional repressor Rex [Bacteroidales bacterium]
MTSKRLPDKTVERLSQYRRALLNYLSGGKQHIFSHEIANLLHITAVQVRRDIMLIGYTGSLRQGYDARELIDLIGKIIDTREGQKVAVVGIGNLGRAIMGYFAGKRTKLSIVAAFDSNPDKVDKIYAGVHCYSSDQMIDIIRKENISIAVISVPGDVAVKVAEELVLAGIKGILNFSPKALNVPEHVYLQEYDMITMLEKIAYFAKKN